MYAWSLPLFFIASAAALAVSPTITTSTPALTPTPEACTYTITHSLKRLSTAPWWDACLFDGTQHIYTATETVQKAIDCEGCQYVAVTQTPLIACPVERITAYKHETTPYTRTQTVCSATAALQSS